jgi:hypothetical protein
MDVHDATSIAMYSHSPPPVYRAHSIAHAPRHFFQRSFKNLRQGNPTLFVVFCGCLIIFLRALFGAGYDEAYSADADAQIQKHPSILARWGPQSQQMLEQQWKNLRKSSGQGLLGKIKKEDDGSAHRMFGEHPAEDALHWLRVMEDKAMAGFGRRPAVPDGHAPPDHEASAEPIVAPIVAPEHVEERAAAPVVPAPAPLAPLVQQEQEPPQAVVAAPDAASAAPSVASSPLPEHDMSEDLDEHDAPTDDIEHRAAAPAGEAALPPQESSSQAAATDAPKPASTVESTPSSSLLDSDLHAKHEDLADEPIFGVDESARQS